MTTPLLTLVADPHPQQSARWTRLLQSDPRFSIVGHAATAREALQLLLTHQPHVAILEVELLRQDAFQILRASNHTPPPSVILISHSPAHAANAFDLDATDYLVTPVSDARFRLALDRALRRTAPHRADRRRAQDNPTPLPHSPPRILLKGSKGSLVLRTSEILCAVAQNTQTRVTVPGESHLINENLGHLEARLPKPQFTRISRSALVNLEHVLRLQPKSHGDQLLILRHGHRLVLTRTRRKAFLSRFTFP